LAALVIILLMMPGPWKSDAALQRGLFPGAHAAPAAKVGSGC
jgi:hypothetical protein